MDFNRINYINTTTMIAVNSNTGTAGNVFNRDPFFQYYSTGLNSDLTTSSMTITFGSTIAVSRIAIMDTNAKSFTIFYNGSTASTFSLSGADTTVSNYTGNVDENKYFKFSTINCTSITIDMKTTQSANEEKRLGLLVISDLYFAPTRVPSANGYRPKVDPKQIVHRLSDGGTRIHNVRKKYAVDIELDYILAADKAGLKTVYDLQEQFIFAPFGTSTGWDGICFESVWEGDFDFHEFSDNANVSGFSGKIRLRETPS